MTDTELLAEFAQIVEDDKFDAELRELLASAEELVGA
jgi:hypothetical protein